MKTNLQFKQKRELFMGLLLLIAGISYGQIVTIPDANFKIRLLQSSPSNTIAQNLNGAWFKIDANNDGQIGIDEALQVSRIDVDAFYISSLEGIINFSNLQVLDCSNNRLTTLDVQGLSNLEILDCSFNYLTTLDVQGLSNLQELDFAFNDLTTLDVQGLSNLQALYCHSNALTTLDVQGLSSLQELDCTGNDLTTLDVQGLSNLQYLDCISNDLTTLDVQGCSNLQELLCFSNALTTLDVRWLPNLETLDCSYNALTTLDVQGCSNLQELYCSYNALTTLDVQGISILRLFWCDNNNLTALYIKNNSTENLSIGNNPNLSYICADDDQVASVQTEVNNLGYSCVVNSFCSSTTIIGNYNTIEGAAFLDLDNNGCDVTDNNTPLKIHVTDGTDSGYVFSTDGYALYTGAGTYTLTPEFEHSYFTASPASVEITFADDLNNITVQDFCVSSNGIYNDAEITIIPTTVARPGFDAEYRLVYKNKGTTTLSGDIVFNYDDEVLDFLSASITPDNESTGTLTWSYSNLDPFGNFFIDIVFNVNSPVETPPVNNGDMLIFIANIQHAETEETPNDNIATLNQTVVGSYDPNDKTCLEGETILPEMVGAYLHYVIRFENTGTYPAENVVVRDLIDASKFDITTLQVTHASHDMKTQIEGNEVAFIFEGINLPFDDATNDGFVAFKIKTLSSLVLDDEVSNKADIYFDFNAPIITNDVVTTVSLRTSTQEIDNHLSIGISPNPVTDILYFNTHLNIHKIEIFDALGRSIQSQHITENKINVAHLANGIYFIKAFTAEGVASEKMIKE